MAPVPFSQSYKPAKTLGMRPGRPDPKTGVAKGTLVLTGLRGQYPPSFYPNEWLEILAAAEGIRKAIDHFVAAGAVSVERAATTADGSSVLKVS